jgi:hypothetical protein
MLLRNEKGASWAASDPKVERLYHPVGPAGDQLLVRNAGQAQLAGYVVCRSHWQNRDRFEPPAMALVTSPTVPSPPATAMRSGRSSRLLCHEPFDSR